MRNWVNVERCEECKDFDMSGTNAWTTRKTCLDCGALTVERKVPDHARLDPDTCPHATSTTVAAPGRAAG
eukprot:11110045-Heterocapsa_arctica.AAC.1